VLFGLYLDKRRHLILDEPVERALCALTGAREQAASETKSDDCGEGHPATVSGSARPLRALEHALAQHVEVTFGEIELGWVGALEEVDEHAREPRVPGRCAVSRHVRAGRSRTPPRADFRSEPEAVSTGNLRVLRPAERLALRAREERAGHGLIRRTGTVLPTPYAAA
jgi:hypothetical protein